MDKTELDWAGDCYDNPMYAAEHIVKLERRIAELEAENKRVELRYESLKEPVEKYMWDACHHDYCPQYGGNTWPACNCGYADLKAALEASDEAQTQ